MTRKIIPIRTPHVKIKSPSNYPFVMYKLECVKGIAYQRYTDPAWENFPITLSLLAYGSANVLDENGDKYQFVAENKISDDDRFGSVGLKRGYNTIHAASPCMHYCIAASDSNNYIETIARYKLDPGESVILPAAKFTAMFHSDATVESEIFNNQVMVGFEGKTLTNNSSDVIVIGCFNVKPLPETNPYLEQI